MNKNVFIISAYPSTQEKLQILKECLASLRRDDFDIILTTNFKITDLELYNLVDYLIFDKTDYQHFMDFGIIPFGHCWILRTDNFVIKNTFNIAYHYDLFRSTYNAVALANSLGYEFFAYIEGDCVMKDFDKLLQIKNQMYQEKKSMFFGKIKMDSYYDYCTLFYGGIPSFYVQKTDTIPYNVEDWIKKQIITESNQIYIYPNINLEIIMYYNFIRYIDNILEYDFPNSPMINVLEYNKIRKAKDFGLYNVFYFDDNDPNSVHIVIYNEDKDDIQIKLYLDDELFLEEKLNVFYWCSRQKDINFILNKKSKLEVYKNGELVDTSIKNLTPEYISYMRVMQKFNRI